MHFINNAALSCLLYLQPDVCVSVPLDLLTQLKISVLSLFSLVSLVSLRPSWSWPRRETVCSSPLWLPAPASRQETPPAWGGPRADSTSQWSWPTPRPRSAACDRNCECSGFTDSVADERSSQGRMKKSLVLQSQGFVVQLPSSGSGVGHSLKEKLPLPQISAAHWFFLNPDGRLLWSNHLETSTGIKSSFISLS